MIPIKSEFSRLSSFICACFFVSMGCITLCLMAEYQFFRQQVQELMQLRHYYQNCIEALKQQIPLSDSKMPSPGQQKKISHIPEPRFLVVNREPEYLKREALGFARSHNLEQPLSSIYDKQPEKSTAKKRRVIPQRTKIARTNPSKHSKKGSPTHKNKRRITKPSIISIQLKKENFFSWPLDPAHFWVSSPFGPRKNPNGLIGFHAGTDLAAVRGTPVKAAAPGTVTQATFHKGYGNMILTVYPNKAMVRYAHLDSIRVRVGQRVKQGDIIGTVGNTGHVHRKRGRDGSHLHLEIYVPDDDKSFKRIDPLYFLH